MDNNETVLITGASSGIGKEFAKVFAAKKYNLVLVGREAESLNEFANELKHTHHIQSWVIAQDLSLPEAATIIVDKLKQQNIEINILVNNAGIATNGLFVRANLSKELEMIAVNITALTALTRLILPSMLNHGRGKILNVASTAAFQPGPFMAVYYASKAYVLSFTQALHEELKGSGLTITALCPGVTRTNLFRDESFKKVKILKLSSIMNADEVAEYGFKALQKGKRIATPGLFNKISSRLVGFLPHRLTMKMVRYLQEAK